MMRNVYTILAAKPLRDETTWKTGINGRITIKCHLTQ
jgi:hypothetical protein